MWHHRRAQLRVQRQPSLVIVHLIDGTHELFRHFYGLRRFSKGQDKPFGAVIGVLNTVLETVEGGGTHVNVSGAAVARHAPHRDEAVKLLEFLTSDAAQRLQADANYEYPIRAGLGGGKTEQLFGPIHPDPVPLAEIAKNRRAASELVDETGFDN